MDQPRHAPSRLHLRIQLRPCQSRIVFQNMAGPSSEKRSRPFKETQRTLIRCPEKRSLQNKRLVQRHSLRILRIRYPAERIKGNRIPHLKDVNSRDISLSRNAENDGDAGYNPHHPLPLSFPQQTLHPPQKGAQRDDPVPSFFRRY